MNETVAPLPEFLDPAIAPAASKVDLFLILEEPRKRRLEG
jgi:hypothetical protein